MNILHHIRLIPARKVWLLALVMVALIGCTEISNMQEQPKYQEPFDASENFDAAAFDLDPNAVPIGFMNEDIAFVEGQLDGEYIESIPLEMTADLILEGKRQYEAFCSPCHGYSGYGDGVIVEEGLIAPNSFHIEDVRTRPVGYYFDQITNGGSVMFSFASRLTPEERWQVIAYIRTLQLSQNAPLDDMPEAVQDRFEDAVELNQTAMSEE